VTLSRLSAGLEETLARIRTSGGLLIICANCLSICDDQGHWHRKAVRVQDHPDIEFSHAICPDCMQKLYPEYVLAKGRDL
jgi:hypothetical protein